MNPLVLHYEFETKDLKIEEQFIELHIEVAEFASNHGVELCIENIEVERVDPVIRFLERTNTPNFERLKSESTMFSRAFCNAPLCSPARAAASTKD